MTSVVSNAIAAERTGLQVGHKRSPLASLNQYKKKKNKNAVRICEYKIVEGDDSMITHIEDFKIPASS